MYFWHLLSVACLTVGGVIKGAMDYFEDAFSYLMTNEGGGEYVNRPGDSGGPTKWGVSLKFYRSLMNDRSLGPDIIKNLTEERAKAIARSEFWDPLNLSLCKDRKVALALLDQAYLGGVPRCATFAQAALRPQAPYIQLDGILGPKFWEACNRGPSSLFLASFVSMLVTSYESIAEIKPQTKPFLQGWLNRVYKIKNIA